MMQIQTVDAHRTEKEFRRAREAGYSASVVNPMIARALLGQREYQRVLDELPAPADGSLTLRFADTDQQLKAQDAVLFNARVPNDVYEIPGGKSGWAPAQYPAVPAPGD